MLVVSERIIQPAISGPGLKAIWNTVEKINLNRGSRMGGLLCWARRSAILQFDIVPFIQRAKSSMPDAGAICSARHHGVIAER